MITIHSFTFNPFQENMYLLFDETKECVVIDPGCYEKHEKEKLISYIDKKLIVHNISNINSDPALRIWDAVGFLCGRHLRFDSGGVGCVMVGSSSRLPRLHLARLLSR